ncbi:hypothetical protein VCHENC02_1539A, partial [Vibrio harveyi]
MKHLKWLERSSYLPQFIIKE